VVDLVDEDLDDRGNLPLAAFEFLDTRLTLLLDVLFAEGGFNRPWPSRGNRGSARGAATAPMAEWAAR
jgi:hypothetical protein